MKRRRKRAYDGQERKDREMRVNIVVDFLTISKA
jgi:hypothetical protein